MADCFQGLQLDLTDESGALSFIADSDNYLKGVMSAEGKGQLGFITDAAAKDTVETLLKQIDNADLSVLSKSAKLKVGRQRNRLTEINKLQRIAQETLDPDTIDELLESYLFNAKKPTFFAKTTPWEHTDSFETELLNFVKAVKTKEDKYLIPAKYWQPDAPPGVKAFTKAQAQEAYDAAAGISHPNLLKKGLKSLPEDNPLRDLNYGLLKKEAGKGVTSQDAVLEFLQSVFPDDVGIYDDLINPNSQWKGLAKVQKTINTVDSVVPEAPPIFGPSNHELAQTLQHLLDENGNINNLSGFEVAQLEAKFGHINDVPDLEYGAGIAQQQAADALEITLEDYLNFLQAPLPTGTAGIISENQQALAAINKWINGVQVWDLTDPEYALLGKKFGPLNKWPKTTEAAEKVLGVKGPPAVKTTSKVEELAKMLYPEELKSAPNSMPQAIQAMVDFPEDSFGESILQSLAADGWQNPELPDHFTYIFQTPELLEDPDIQELMAKLAIKFDGKDNGKLVTQVLEHKKKPALKPKAKALDLTGGDTFSVKEFLSDNAEFLKDLGGSNPLVAKNASQVPPMDKLQHLKAMAGNQGAKYGDLSNAIEDLIYDLKTLDSTETNALYNGPVKMLEEVFDNLHATYKNDPDFLGKFAPIDVDLLFDWDSHLDQTFKMVVPEWNPHYTPLAQAPSVSSAPAAGVQSSGPIPKKFTRAPKQSADVNTGTHKKVDLLDEDGNEWLFKKIGHNEDWRSDVENGAHEFGRAMGFDLADSDTIVWDGDYGIVQRKWNADKNLKGTPANSLTKKQREEIAEHHLLDWLLDNDDAHEENFMLLMDGSVVGIDKGRAWKHLGNPSKAPKLELGRLSQQADPYYERLYRFYSDTKKGRLELDDTYRTVMARAKVMEALDDDMLRELLRKELASRPEFNGVSTDQLIENIIARKSTLSKDFDTFYGTIYKKAGLSKPKLTETRVPKAKKVRRGGGTGKTDEGFYQGWSDELFEEAIDSRSHGKATFWASDELEGGYEFFWGEKGLDGNDLLRGELKLRKNADQKMLDWLQKQGVNTAAGTNAPVKKLKGPLSDPTFGAGTHENIVSKLQNAAKTINFHATDGTYNQTKVGEIPKVKLQLNTISSDLASGKYDSFGDEWINALRQQVDGYLGDIDVLENAMATQGKLPYFLEAREIEIKAKPKTQKPKAPAGFTPQKVTKKKNFFNISDEGSFDVDTGVLTEQAGAPFSHYKHDIMRGEVYEIVLNDNVTVTYAPWNGHSGYNDVAASFQGRMRVSVKDFKTIDDLNIYRDFLDSVGIKLSPAEDLDLELLYWRQFIGAGTQYSDQGTKAAWQEYLNWLSSKPNGVNPEEEIAFIKKALTDSYTDAQGKKIPAALKKKDLELSEKEKRYLPKFKHEDVLNPSSETGRPFWMRADYDPAAIDKKLKSWAGSSMTGGANQRGILKSGAMYSTEERYRKLRRWVPTMSPGDDMNTGGANYIFTRVNQADSMDIVYSPDALGRLDTFSFNSDHYGAMHLRETEAKWSQNRWSGLTGSGNETNFRDSASFLDDVEIMVVSDAKVLKEWLAFLRSQGITEIRGVKIEDRFVSNRGKLQKNLPLVRNAWRRRNGIPEQ